VALARPSRRGIEPADVVLGAALVGVFAVCMLRTRGVFFLADEWRLANRGGSPLDYLRHYNGHLSTTFLAVYRAAFEVVGLRHPVAVRTVSMAALVAVPALLHLTARRRVGALVAAVAALALFGVPHPSIPTPALNFWMACLGVVVTAWAMLRPERRYDLPVAAGLVFALSSGSPGTVAAAAAVVHAALVRPHVRRVVAVALPTAGWVLWWLVEGRHGPDVPAFFRYDAVGVLRAVLRGLWSTVEGVALGNPVGGTAVAVAATALLAFRLRRDRASAANQLAWTAGLVFWWFGLALSRGALLTKEFHRYTWVAVLVLVLGLLPAGVVRWRPPLPAAAGAAVLVALCTLIAATRSDDLERATAAQREASARARQQLLVVSLEPSVVPDPGKPNPGFGTAEDFRRAGERWGYPSSVTRQTIDGALVRAGIPVHRRRLPRRAPCRSSTEPVEVVPAGTIAIGAPDRAAELRLRRFGSRFVAFTKVRPGQQAVVRFFGASSPTPWLLRVDGGCVVER
jgi:hypothetical protein